jgi:peptidoglycan hydrolase CwlO-like protein
VFRVSPKFPALACLGLLAVLVALALDGAPARGDLQSQINSRQSSAQQLQAAVDAETARITATENGLADAQERLSSLNAVVDRRRTELEQVQADLVKNRDRLTVLENRFRRASAALADNLRAGYENGQVDLISVVLNSSSFSDMMDRVDFLKRVAKHNARILDNTKQTRTEVLATTRKLADLQDRNRALAASAEKARNQAAAVQTAILNRRATLLAGRADKQAELDQVRGELSSLKAKQARAARAAARAAQQVVEDSGATPNTSIGLAPGGAAQAPDGAPEAVRLVIAAGNAIAGLPYLYGGGHASFQASAYDCSGSVSYALAAAGLVTSPLDSTSFESWGEAGPGQYITVYANAGHAYMVVGGWRFDTSALSSGGTRWTQEMRSSAGFVARHPPGL